MTECPVTSAANIRQLLEAFIQEKSATKGIKERKKEGKE
jgi:hypothetical protein